MPYLSHPQSEVRESISLTVATEMVTDCKQEKAVENEKTCFEREAILWGGGVVNSAIPES